MKSVGKLAMICGCLFLLWALTLDTSVATPFGRVNNIGLMQDRQNYIIVSSIVLISGLLMFIFAEKNKGSYNQTGDGSINGEKSGAKNKEFTGERVLTNDAYKIYLVEKYGIKYNEILKKYVYNDTLYESVDEVLIALHIVDAPHAIKLSSAPTPTITSPTEVSPEATRILHRLEIYGYRCIGYDEHSKSWTLETGNGTVFYQKFEDLKALLRNFEK